MDAIVKRFFKRWGEDIFADEECLRQYPSRPLILLVDWQQDAREFAGWTLSERGYRVAMASNARVMFKLFKPDDLFRNVESLLRA